MSSPRVSVICLCYNHGRFVKEAIQSVCSQSYKNIQLIVVDDASIDNSVEIIQEVIKGNPEITFIPLDKNIGNCSAFNKGLAKATGEFIIDFAADDVLFPNRVEVGVTHFAKVSASYGVQFSDAVLVNEKGEHISFHSDRFTHHVPQGNIYKNLISTYFINSPTMMVRKIVFDKLSGYDETLAYEDFDFWIRSSREFEYFYIPKVLVKNRIVKGSMGQRQFKRSGAQLTSTFQVCEKIIILNRNSEEQRHLNKRIGYEMRVCLKLFDFELALRYVKLWLKNSKLNYEV